MIWELIGAVVGAGLASGREIAAFFAQYGDAGYAGIAASGVVMYFLGTIRYPISFPYQWMQKTWRLMFSALLIATGGAMLSGAGEVISLTLPIHGAYWLGYACTLILSWILARKTKEGLTYISKAMLLVLIILIGLSLFADPIKAVDISSAQISESLYSGIKYGGFNAALQASVLARYRGNANRQRLCVFGASFGICIILSMGNAAVLRSPGLISEPLPFLKYASSYGRWGYALFASSLYMAILSTQVVCLKGLNGTVLPICCILATSLMGFSSVVERVYPILGGICVFFLLYAKFSKCAARPFHSEADVL